MQKLNQDAYEVLETLGSGTFGTVCKLKRKSDGKFLVWKAINFGSMSEKEKTQLVAEVNILRELRNPFIVRYSDRIVDKPKTLLYIIMEYCPGGDLSRLIRQHKKDRTTIDEAFIWKVYSQAVLALKECHRRIENGEMRPIIHRDLKPANILLDSSQNIKMGDFGLAKELSSKSKLAQTNVGTPYYMAPEIINEKDYDEKSDIWSLGCLLYELAALKPPFDAANAVSLAVKINQGHFLRIPKKYSDALHDTIK
jgi:serine/threonine protein kinase